MAEIVPKLLYIGNSVASNVYTVSSNVGSYSIVRTVNVCNTASVDKTCSLNIVPASGSAGANNRILSNILIPGNDVLVSDTVIVLNAGDSVYFDPADSNLTLTLSGVEYSA